MRSVAFLCAFFLVTASASAADVAASSRVDAVTVYPDGATVTRIVAVDLPAGDSTLILSDLPPNLDATSLRVEGETNTPLAIGSIDARAPKAVPPADLPELEKKIEAARDQSSALADKIAAQTARKHFTERFANEVPLGLGEKAEARPLAEWRSAFTAVADDITAADDAIRELKLAKREIDREIARLDAQARANPPRKMEVRIDVAAQASASGTLRVSYSVRGARWTPLYDARLDSGGRDRKPALELVRRAEIVQQTGEDWTDAALSVSTVRTAKGGSAPELNPVIVRFNEPQVAQQDELKVRGIAPAPAPPPLARGGNRLVQDAAAGIGGDVSGEEPALERQATLQTDGYQAVFRVPGRISVATQEGAKSFRIGTATIAPDLVVRSTPALDPTAFLEASFKNAEEAPLLPGRVSLYRDGIFVGRGAVALAGKDELVHLGFGADDQIKVTRTVQHKTEGSTGLITSSKTDDREFRISVRNGHGWPAKVIIEDQQPVSETEDVQVELLPTTTKPTETNPHDRRGVLSWTLDLQAREQREITLAWRVRWPAAKSVVYDPPRL
jgi:uncharacterized protein (TIGR02231 family)